VAAVGESHYLDTLESFGGGLTDDGVRNPDQTAILLPEPDNAYDPGAVRVMLLSPGGQAATVAYLSRSDAGLYRPAIDRLAELGRVVGCLAVLRGGRDRGSSDRGAIGVWLLLDTPAALMHDVDELGLRPR
jgi:hypothetical protein